MVDQEKEPLDPLAVSQQKEALPSERNAEEPNSSDVLSNPSSEAEKKQLNEHGETTAVSKDGKIQLKKDDVIKFDDNDETIMVTEINREKVRRNLNNFFNVRGEDGLMTNVNLVRALSRKLDFKERNTLIIPRERHSDSDYKEDKLDNFKISLHTENITDEVEMVNKINETNQEFDSMSIDESLETDITITSEKRLASSTLHLQDEMISLYGKNDYLLIQQGMQIDKSSDENGYPCEQCECMVKREDFFKSHRRTNCTRKSALFLRSM